jgi:hypothetical protein
MHREDWSSQRLSLSLGQMLEMMLKDCRRENRKMSGALEISELSGRCINDFVYFYGGVRPVNSHGNRVSPQPLDVVQEYMNSEPPSC